MNKNPNRYDVLINGPDVKEGDVIIMFEFNESETSQKCFGLQVVGEPKLNLIRLLQTGYDKIEILYNSERFYFEGCYLRTVNNNGNIETIKIFYKNFEKL